MQAAEDDMTIDGYERRLKWKNRSFENLLMSSRFGKLTNRGIQNDVRMIVEIHSLVGENTFV